MASTESLSIRLHKDPGSREGDDRTLFQEDRDIVLYSSAFKRLLSVTQVASGSTGFLLHTRLTHSLQVSQVGRRLAEKLNKKQPELAKVLGGIDPDLVETACLAHDIGHPPFGHLAEEVLDEKADSFGGFEGNAQSFRVVTQLGIRSRHYPGLNLTRGSLRGLLKYPWVYGNRPEENTHRTKRKPKWGAYDCDREVFDWVWNTDTGGPIRPRAVEAELMDWSDDVTYSVHDVEDFFRAGLIPLHLLRSFTESGKRKERDRFFEYVSAQVHRDKALDNLGPSDIEKIFDDLMIYAGFRFEQPYEGTTEDHASLRTFTSRLINRFINAVILQEPTSESTVKRDELQQQEIAILKQLTWFYVIEAPGLAIQHEAQKKIVSRLADIFLAEAVQLKPSGVLPIAYREILNRTGITDDQKRRTAIDLLASMTETQATDIYRRLEGISLDSGLGRILV